MPRQPLENLTESMFYVLMALTRGDAYGAEITTGGRTWLLYNGDDFGATGFGVAEQLEP